MADQKPFEGETSNQRTKSKRSFMARRWNYSSIESLGTNLSRMWLSFGGPVQPYTAELRTIERFIELLEARMVVIKEHLQKYPE